MEPNLLRGVRLNGFGPQYVAPTELVAYFESDRYKDLAPTEHDPLAKFEDERGDGRSPHRTIKKRPEGRALSCKSTAVIGLEIEIHVEFVRMRAQAKRIVFFGLHIDPVIDEVFVEDVAFEQELMVGLQGFQRASE